MNPRPTIFISAVTSELKGARDLVAKTLEFMGYQPVFQDIFGTQTGNLCGVLRDLIDPCEGLIQLVGFHYGSEPPMETAEFGRVSYTQYEALYALQQGKKVFHFVDVTPGSAVAEPEDKRELQQAYRERIRTENNPDLFHEVDLKSDDALARKVHEIKNALEDLRRKYNRWSFFVTASQTLLIVFAVVIVAMIGWLIYERPFSGAPITEQAASSAIVDKDYSRAFDILTQLSAADPANIDYHRRIEDCARQGRLERPFLEHYLGLVDRDPKNAMFHNYLGNAYLLMDPDDTSGAARKHYETALSLNPDLSLPLANLGILKYREGKTSDAELMFKRYLDREPTDAQGWVNLGLLYLNQVQSAGMNAELVTNAEQALQKAIDLEPGSSSAYKGLGRLYAATDRKPEALDAFQRSLALDYDQPEVRQQVELLAWESEGDRVASPTADDFRTRAADAADSAAPYVIIAMQRLEHRDFRALETVCREWSAEQPENPLPWRLLGRACQEQGRDEEAQQHLANAVRLAKRGTETKGKQSQ